MFFEKNINTRRHNWLMPHICTRQVRKHARLISGTVLDVGCGRKPYADIIRPSCDQYIGLDHPESVHGLQDVDVVGDAMAVPFRDGAVDWLVSFQVMEHLPEPLQFLKELRRVLKPGGGVFLTTPFMWGEHEEPRDYYRFTRHGLRYIAEKAGFEVVSVEADTGFWVVAVLRFNYWLVRFARGPFRLLVIPMYLNQYLAMALDRLDRNYKVDTATFTTILRKPECP